MAEVVDPYLDSDTGLLSNLVGAVSQSALDIAEADLVASRAVQLLEHPPRATGDLEEFRVIHRHLFQDVYAWAGDIRTVDIRKNIDGAEFFLPRSMIDRLSYHYDQWNAGGSAISREELFEVYQA